MACGGEDIQNDFSPIHRPGHAVLIVNIEPTGSQGRFEFQTRKGAREDSGNLQKVFIDHLGLKWINPTAYWHQNLPLSRWDHRKKKAQENNDLMTFPTFGTNLNANECCLRCNIQSLDYSESNCFVLAISSHGRELNETEIIFSDGESILLTEIFEALNDKSCPTLRGKPRIIILQACRTNFQDEDRAQMMQDSGVIIPVDISEHTDMTAEQDDGNKTGSGTSHKEAPEGNVRYMETEENKSSPETEECENMEDCCAVIGRFTVEPTEDLTFQHLALNKMPDNFLLVYPVVSGQKAQRNEGSGSWLIDAMTLILSTKYKSSNSSLKPVNFLHFLTFVAGYIAREKEKVVYEREGTGKIKKDDKGNKLIDKAKSGQKNAVCFYHRLVKPLIFYPKEKEEQPIPNPFDFTRKKKKDTKTKKF